MFGHRRRSSLGFGLFFSACALFAIGTFIHSGSIFGDGGGGSAGFLSKETIFYGGIGLGIALATVRLFDIGLDVFREHMLPRLGGLSSYIVLAFAITAAVGLVFQNLISASLFASGVGYLALLGIVALYGITFMGGLGGATGHRAQWRKGIGSVA